jgi:hypothetical protein
MRSHRCSGRVGDLRYLRCPIPAVVPKDDRNALVLRQLVEHISKVTCIAGQACGCFWGVQCHDPAPTKRRLTSTHDCASQARLADLVESSRDLDETVLHEIFSLCVVPHQGVGETNHADVLHLIQVFECRCMFGDRCGRSSHLLHHLLRRTGHKKCCSRVPISF